MKASPDQISVNSFGMNISSDYFPNVIHDINSKHRNFAALIGIQASVSSISV